MELLSTNVRSEKLRGASLLIYGTCIEAEFPEILKRLSAGRVPLHACLEKEHMDTVGFKLSTILTTAQPKQLIVLSVDGSPHCLQLHFAAEQAKKLTGSPIEIEHFTIERGELKSISSKAVDIARHLFKIEEFLSGRCGSEPKFKDRSTDSGV